MRNLAILTLVLLLPLFAGEGISLIENGGFNAEDSALSGWSVRNGGLGTTKAAKGVFKANVTKLSERPWTMELHQLVQPPVPQGGLVVIEFEYNISAGYSFNFYWQVEKSPWPKLLSMHLDKADGWQTVRAAVPIHEALPEKSTALSFHLGGTVGTCELRNLSLTLLPEGTSPNQVESTVQPVLGGDFYDKDWRKLAQKRLQDIRTVEYTLTWKPNAEVKVRQISRPFSFGVECPLSFLAFKNVPKEIDKNLLPQYVMKTVLDKSLFDIITFSDGLTWRDYEAWGKDALAPQLANMHKLGFKVRGHALYIPAFMFAPVKCRKMQVAQLDAALRTHISEKAGIPGIDQWDVVHGVMDYQEIYNLIGVESLSDAFITAKENAKNALLCISDLNSICAQSEVPLHDTVEFIKWLKQDGKGPEAIVLGCTVNRPDVAPQAMEKRLDYVQRELKIPIFIAGFAVNAENDEQQTAMMQDYLTLFFPHPGVHGVTFGELWAAARLNPRMALLDARLAEKPAFAALKKLLKETWLTNASLRTDAKGKATFRAFKGEYEFSSGNETRKETIGK
ncbi:MAG: endo-1,4-beta-xylanase [Victivallales bacterium]|nr:endo-1,4-beta-xylanase [Victivallales bacterium]